MSGSLPKTPSFRLDGRRALITGAGRGIGRASAIALAEAGAEVFLAARTEDEIEALASQIGSEGGTAKAIVLDVTDTPSVKATIAAEGPFQILVNSAGGNRPAELSDITEEDYDFIADLNLRASIFVAQSVASGLIEANLPGSIINVSSQMGHVGGPKRTVYCATKHAIEGATKAMAWELGQHSIRVNTLCPTFIKTPMVEGFLEEQEFHDFVMSNIALRRIGEVEDIMGAVVFLASDASTLVTGSALMVDGGWTAA
ncbi:MAG: 3-oxoacyl-ACP reductase [Rhodospirillaceae bacterium]|nr:3-oxoacyl-ACP reductase [Rhodospirillaceae bacterium]